MPRYFFHVRDGVSLPDNEGTELPNLAAARQEAIRLAGAIIAEDAQRFDLGEDWRLEVTNVAGIMMFRLDFSVVEFPGQG